MIELHLMLRMFRRCLRARRVVLLAAGACCLSATAEARPPNLIVIVADDLAASMQLAIERFKQAVVPWT